MRFFIAIIFICSSFLSYAQGFRVRHKLPGATTNTARAIFEISPGNYFAAGFTLDSVTGANRLYVMGLDSQGQILWKKKYGSNKLQYLDASFCQRSYYKQGNYVYHAGCVIDTTNKQVGCLTKFDLNGDTVWQKIYRDPDPLEDVIPQMVTGSVDGGFLITGFFQNNSANPYSKCMLIKTDANGKELWRQKIAKVTPDTHDGKAILQDSASKKIVIVGYQYIGNAQSWTIYDNAIMLDSLGLKLSQRSYAGGKGVLLDLIQTKDKKMVAVGYAVQGQTSGGDDLTQSFIVKFGLDTPTYPIWKVNNFDRLSLTNGFNCIKELSNGNMLIGGVLDTMFMNGFPFNCLARMTKVDSGGTIIWNRYYDYKINEVSRDNILDIKSVELCSDGGWVAAIEVSNIPAPNPFFFVKYDSTGCDSSLAYCQSLVGVGIHENKLPSDQVSVFPNPTNGILNISVANTGYGNLLVSLQDVTGRTVKEKVFPSSSDQIDLNDLSNGVYIISVTKDKGLLYKTKLVKQD